MSLARMSLSLRKDGRGHVRSSWPRDAGVVQRALRPPIPAGSNCPPAILKLIKESWAQRPPDRPTFATIVDILRTITTSGEAEGFGPECAAVADPAREIFDEQ
eukprot:SAG22_NODE_728_length_7596_cov_342.279178_6_plen_103_part_00